MPTDESRRVHTGQQRLLRCGACKRTADCTADELLGYARSGWPKCCDEVMTLFTSTEPPGPDDTGIDLPPVA
jgi:hypothetical protein